MTNTVIQVQDLSKRYVLGASGSTDGLRHVIHDLVMAPFRRLKGGVNEVNGIGRNGEAPKEKSFLALDGVSFEIQQGEVVGIIGRNGAGKSTLLKILSRITEPTTGRVQIRGRVASLLEVGTGFHPELTGRENIFLNGAILGMTRAEIKKKFDEIVAFAEVDKFLDTPVKRYSSGMYVRLAFAVAAHLEPEILVVDEVLAVGDAQFQKKCLGKMTEVAQGGRTVLFVSHQLPSVRALCSKVIWMDRGKVRQVGLPEKVIGDYLGETLSLTQAESIRKNGCVLESAVISDPKESSASALEAGKPWQVCVRYSLEEDLQTGVTLRISTIQGVVIVDVHECIRGGNVRRAGKYETTFDLSNVKLAPGSYLLSVNLMVHHGPLHLIADPYARFEVVGTLPGFNGTHWPYDIGGFLYAEPSVKTTALERFQPVV